MVNKILNLMIDYNAPDVRRINHAIKVYTFAVNIAKNEKCSEKELEMISIVSILHDIGIHEAERKYTSTNGKYQEIEGIQVAKELLRDIDMNETFKNRIFYLIGNHHSYEKIDGIDFQVLVEADFLVNIYEDTIDIKTIKNIEEKVFKTESGKELLRKMYL